ncbi:hypothetical protein CRUP_035821 [Coryphaenoides rupestris]|nr:hypothetical protein CRUP_035821 [Coryphaenoides rupestris]
MPHVVVFVVLTQQSCGYGVKDEDFACVPCPQGKYSKGKYEICRRHKDCDAAVPGHRAAKPGGGHNTNKDNNSKKHSSVRHIFLPHVIVVLTQQSCGYGVKDEDFACVPCPQGKYSKGKYEICRRHKDCDALYRATVLRRLAVAQASGGGGRDVRLLACERYYILENRPRNLYGKVCHSCQNAPRNNKECMKTTVVPSGKVQKDPGSTTIFPHPHKDATGQGHLATALIIAMSTIFIMAIAIVLIIMFYILKAKPNGHGEETYTHMHACAGQVVKAVEAQVNKLEDKKDVSDNVVIYSEKDEFDKLKAPTQKTVKRAEPSPAAPPPGPPGSGPGPNLCLLNLGNKPDLCLLSLGLLARDRTPNGTMGAAPNPGNNMSANHIGSANQINSASHMSNANHISNANAINNNNKTTGSLCSDVLGGSEVAAVVAAAATAAAAAAAAGGRVSAWAGAARRRRRGGVGVGCQGIGSFHSQLACSSQPPSLSPSPRCASV